MGRISKIKDLMFPVELYPIYTSLKIGGVETKIEIPNSKIVMNTEDKIPLGVVSNAYKLITNIEAINLGKKCCSELFGFNETEDIEIFKVDAPSTASYCHIDLVHKNYIMNLWDEDKRSDVYIPYIRITNSYNTARALRFDIGFCRKICFNGVIFEKQTIKFTFSHIKYEFNKDISFRLEDKNVKDLFNKFVSYINKLKNYKITKENSLDIIMALFRIKNKFDIDFKKKKESIEEYDLLLKAIENKLYFYIEEMGENGYSLFNVITDIASHKIENRYFQRDMNSMQRLAGQWINSFQENIKDKDFSIEKYIELLKKPKKNNSYHSNKSNTNVEL